MEDYDLLLAYVFWSGYTQSIGIQLFHSHNHFVPSCFKPKCSQFISMFELVLTQSTRWFVPILLINSYNKIKQEQLSDWNNLVIAWHKENMILLKEKPLFYTCDFWTIKVPISVIFFLSLLSTVILMLMLILAKVSLSLGACTSKWTPC